MTATVIQRTITVVLALAVTPAAIAQCKFGTPAFATIGGGPVTNRLRIDPAGSFGSSGLEFGRFWACEDSNDLNNFIPGDPERKMAPAGTGLCASTDPAQAGGGWWQTAQTTKRGIEGFISATGCFANNCNLAPAPDLCVVVEDWGSFGPPGSGDTAYFVGFRSDETPPNIRRWDLSKFCGPQDSRTDCDAEMREFPVPVILTRRGVPGHPTWLYNSSTDPAVNVYVYNPDAGAASEIIASYDLMIHWGINDPGRDRNATGCAAPNADGRCWNLLQSVPYDDASLIEMRFDTPCEDVTGDLTSDAFIALGLSFVGGGGGPVPSQLVGRAIQLECDPVIADPGATIPRSEHEAPRTPARARGDR